MTNPDYYRIPAQLLQGIVNALGALPWGQINGVMAPLMAEVRQQEAAAAEPPPPAPDAPKPDA